MNSAVLYGTLAVVLVCLVAFIGYYAYRLAKAAKETKATTTRFDEFVRRQSLVEKEWGGGSGAAPGASVPVATVPGKGGAQAQGAFGVKGGAPPTNPVRVYEQKLGLKSLSDEAVFMRRGEAGDVVVQIGGKRPTPLNFVLDPRARHMLSAISMRASVDLGSAWSILAEDDEEGRLRITVIT